MTDWKDIVLKGYMNNSDKLPEYFYREWKKKEKKHYTKNEFFHYCLKVAKQLQENIEHSFDEWKRAKQKVIELHKGKGKDENGMDWGVWAKKELEGTDINDFRVNLFRFTERRYKGQISNSDINFIIEAINKAQQKADNIPDKQTEIEEKSLSLEDLFTNVSDLHRITEQLKDKSFINQKGQWVGKAPVGKAEVPVESQLSALALVIQEKGFLKRNKYYAKELHKAFNEYFHIKTGGNYFKPSVIDSEDIDKKYKGLFSFI